MNKITVNLELSSKARRDKRHDILLRIVLNKQKKRISTRMYVSKEDYNSKARYGQWIRQSHSQYSQKNKELKEILTKAESACGELEKQGIAITLEAIVRFLKNENLTTTFTDYADIYRERAIARDQVDVSKQCKAIMAKFHEFFKKKQILFSDITLTALTEYEIFLTKEKNNCINTVNKDLSIINRIIRSAVREKLIPMDKNPFIGYRFKLEKTTKQRLTEEQLQALIKLDLEKDSYLWHTRNLFLFSFYAP